MNIVLIGYRGTGKSVVGKLIALRLHMQYISIDNAIVDKAGISIPEIVEKFGWPGFRDLESAEVINWARQDNIVVDTGGGIIERPENIELLKQNASVFWLKASVDTIISRIHGNTERPALTKGKTFTEEVSEVLELRTPKYKDAANFEIETEALTVEQIANQIIYILHNYFDLYD